MCIEEGWFKISVEFERWRSKYIDFENYMKGSVYHYTNISALEGIIKNKTLWVTKSDFLNDKTEYIYAINLINKVFNKNKYAYLNNNALKNIIQIIKKRLSRSFIFSTSLNGDSTNLWGNYSKGEGYNICFNLEKVFGKFWNGKIFVVGNKKQKDGTSKQYMIPRVDQYKTVSMTPGKVIYDPSIQEETITDIFNFMDSIYKSNFLYYKEIINLKNNDTKSLDMLNTYTDYAIGAAQMILSNQVQLFKNPVFKQDEEYRILFDINRKIDVIKYRAFNNVFVPYIEVIFEGDNDNKLPIDKIIIGPKNNLDIAEKGLRSFLVNQGYKMGGDLENKLLIKNSDVPLRY